MNTPRTYPALRTLENPADLTRYLHLKQVKKEVEAELKALEPAIYSALLDEDGATTEAHGFTLAVRTRHSYEYSPAVERLATELKALKRYEEKTGVADCVRATGYVTVRKAPPPPEAPASRPPLRLVA